MSGGLQNFHVQGILFRYDIAHPLHRGRISHLHYSQLGSPLHSFHSGWSNLHSISTLSHVSEIYHDFAVKENYFYSNERCISMYYVHGTVLFSLDIFDLGSAPVGDHQFS